ncbi:hypothetical protein BOX15_Mlig029774g2, partial [Macrostomum lignano]
PASLEIDQKQVKPKGLETGKLETMTSESVGVQPDSAKEDSAEKPLNYLNSSQFTSELFKIEVKNFRPHTTVAMLKKRMQSLGLEPHKVKVMPNSWMAFVTFKNADQRDKALSVLPGHIWRGQALTAKLAKPKADPFGNAAAADSGQSSSAAKRPRLDTDTAADSKPAPLSAEAASELLRDAVTPLWRLGYEEQLKQKSQDMSSEVKQLTRQVAAVGGISAGSVEMMPIVASPVVDKYRNKCQFTVAWSPTQTDSVVVGFRVGRYRDGEADVYPPDTAAVVPTVIVAVVRRLQALLNEPDMKRRAPPYDAKRHVGCWKAATVRCNSSNRTLLYLDIHQPFLTANDTSDKTEMSLRDFIENRLQNGLLGDQDGCVASLHVVYTDHGGGETNGLWRHLGGDPDITETLGGLSFRVSPAAFFQVNTAAAEVLHNRIYSMLQHGESDSDNQSSALLDVCCGTGTIGLSLARYFSQVVGIELIADAVRDAQLNAQRNGIENASFVCGRAEDTLPREAKLLAETVSDLRVVLDPPRGGLQPSVLSTIRRCRSIRRLLYVSCCPRAARSNFVDLCRPASNKWRGDPFRLALVQPVDLFPLTKHCELLLLFVREPADAAADASE